MMYIMIFSMYEVYMEWSTAEARKNLARLLEAVDEEPQVITNRGHAVGVIVAPAEYAEFSRWRVERERPSLAERIDALHVACADEDYALEVPERSDRANPFAEAADELPR